MSKRLVKGKKMIWGVCSGLADYFVLDPTIIRLAFLISVLFFGTGLLLYIILGIVMPNE